MKEEERYSRLNEVRKEGEGVWPNFKG